MGEMGDDIADLMFTEGLSEEDAAARYFGWDETDMGLELDEVSDLWSGLHLLETAVFEFFDFNYELELPPLLTEVEFVLSRERGIPPVVVAALMAHYYATARLIRIHNQEWRSLWN